MKDKVIKIIQAAKMTEQPKPNLVYNDGDLEELIIENGFDYSYKDNKFTITKGERCIEFKYEEVENRFGNDIKEILITLY